MNIKFQLSICIKFNFTKMSNILVNKLMKFAIEQSNKGNHFFCDYSGHTNTIIFFGYSGKWALYKTPIETFSCGIDELTDQKVKAWINYFKINLKK